MNRKLKIYEQTMGKNYTQVPTIILKGKWLNDYGFTIGEYVDVDCEGDKIILTKSSQSNHKISLEEKINGLSYNQKKKLTKLIDNIK